MTLDATSAALQANATMLRFLAQADTRLTPGQLRALAADLEIAAGTVSEAAAMGVAMLRGDMP